MTVERPSMTEDAARFYTALFSLFTIVGGLGAGIYTVKQYLDTRQKEVVAYNLQVATAQLEAKKPFYQKHLELCSEASSAASTIATTPDLKERKASINTFWRLWDGPLAVVEGGRVARAMIEFGDCLQSECPNLKALSIGISHSCRDEISANFDLHLSQLPK